MIATTTTRRRLVVRGGWSRCFCSLYVATGTNTTIIDSSLAERDNSYVIAITGAMRPERLSMRIGRTEVNLQREERATQI